MSTLFEDHAKANLSRIINLQNGSTKYYEPHWRHLRFIRNESLCHQLEMRMNPIGIAERLKIFGKKGMKELKALVLEEFGVFKPKSKLRIGYAPGYYLTVKNCQNEELMEQLEDEMGQNMNKGVQYFKDILFVETEIMIASVLMNLSIADADRMLYPLKS
nr:uncharacterized protein LOC111134084 [Crassostrea virginica]